MTGQCAANPALNPEAGSYLSSNANAGRRPSASIIEDFFEPAALEQGKIQNDFMTSTPPTASRPIVNQTPTSAGYQPQQTGSGDANAEMTSVYDSKYPEPVIGQDDWDETFRKLEASVGYGVPGSRQDDVSALNGHVTACFPSPPSEDDNPLLDHVDGKLMTSYYCQDNTFTARSVAEALCGTLSARETGVSSVLPDAKIQIKSEADDLSGYVQELATPKFTPADSTTTDAILQPIKIEQCSEKPSCRYQERFILPKPEKSPPYCPPPKQLIGQQKGNKTARRPTSLGFEPASGRIRNAGGSTTTSGVGKNIVTTTGDGRMVNVNTTLSGVRVITNPSIPVSVTQTASGSQILTCDQSAASFPLTPPGSLPGSPDHVAAKPTPTPPLYPELVKTPGTAIVTIPTPEGSVPIAIPVTPVTGRPRATHPGCTTIKYNRKNNPELEKRRIHYCDYPGKKGTVCLYD